MKKTYTRKQITEAISYWKNQLNHIDEGIFDMFKSKQKQVPSRKKDILKDLLMQHQNDGTKIVVSNKDRSDTRQINSVDGRLACGIMSIYVDPIKTNPIPANDFINMIKSSGIKKFSYIEGFCASIDVPDSEQTSDYYLGFVDDIVFDADTIYLISYDFDKAINAYNKRDDFFA